MRSVAVLAGIFLAVAIADANLVDSADTQTCSATEGEHKCDTQQTNKQNDAPFSPTLLFGPAPLEPTPQTTQVEAWMERMSDPALTATPDQTDLVKDSIVYLFPQCQSELVAAIASGDDEQQSVTLDRTSACFKMSNITMVEGKFDAEGFLSGHGIIRFKNETYLVGAFQRGVLHGLVREFWCKFGECVGEFEPDEDSVPVYLHKVSWYRHGKRIGHAWEFLAGGGVMTGKVSSVDGVLAGADLIYVYPDNHTLLVGSFEDGGVLTSARESRIASVSFDGNDMAVLEPEPARGPEYRLDMSNATHLTHSPDSLHLCDPMESQYLRVAESSVPGAGSGVFLRKAVKRNEVVSLYGGVRANMYVRDQLSYYKIDNDWVHPNQIIDIPEGFRKPEEYCATLGHIVNHSKTPNAAYLMIDHPRFGRIRNIVALADLEAGEELFCDYGYLERYHQMETFIKSFLHAGRTLTKTNEKEFNTLMKDNVKFLKAKMDDYKPYLSIMKTALQLLK